MHLHRPPPPPPLQIIIDEGLAENAEARGAQLQAGLRSLAAEYPAVLGEVRGRGLLCALVVREGAVSRAGKAVSALDLCYGFKDAASRWGTPAGLLAKPTHDTTIRLAPPLVITAAQVDECLGIMRTAVRGIVGGP